MKASPADGATAAREQFEAAASSWEHLAWIAQPVRVERVLDAQHQSNVVLRKDQRHQVLFFHADTVLPAERAPSRGAHLHDLSSGVDHALLGAGLVGIPEDQWVQVAVTRVKDVGNSKARFGRDCLD